MYLSFFTVGQQPTQQKLKRQKIIPQKVTTILISLPGVPPPSRNPRKITQKQFPSTIHDTHRETFITSVR